VLIPESLVREAAGHRRVLDGLHFHRVWRRIPLQFRDHQSAGPVQAEHVQSVERIASRGLPSVELEGHHPNVAAKDLRMGKHPPL
jgi:hypothetical protein